MALSMLPVSAFAAQPEEALYAQMLELGLVDGDGTLIKDSTFTVEDGTRLSSLDELVEWLNQCGEDDLDTRITVDATGRSATAEQFMYALSIEYQMADLAQTLSRLASGSGSVSPMSAGSSVDTTVHDLILAPSVERDGNILTFHIGLYDKNTDPLEPVSAPHDIKIEAGLFADFLPAYAEDFAVDGGQVPGTNYFKDFTIPKGSSSISFKIDLGKLRTNYLSQYDGLWDGNTYMLLQVRTDPYQETMPASTVSYMIEVAPSDSPDPIVSAITGGTQIGKRDGSGASVVPYHLDWQQNNSATEKVTVNGTDYFKINTAVPAARGYDYSTVGTSNTTHGWMDTFNQAIKLGVGDPDDPKVNLENVTLWTKDGSRDIKPMSISIMEGEDLVWIARSSWSHDNNDFTDPDDSTYLTELAKVQNTSWDSPNQNFYNQVKNHNWRVRRFRNVEVPITPTQSNFVWYPQDWYLPVSWIEQNDDADIRPEEILMHGALTIVDETAPTVVSVDTCARTPRYTGSADYYYSYFYPGNVVPIVVTFSEPVYGDYELAYLEGTETKYLSSNSGVPYFSTDVTSNGDILSNTRVFYYYVASTDCTGIQVLGVKPVDEAACTDVYGNKFKAKTDGEYKEFNTTVLDGHIQGGNLEDSVLSMSATVDSQDPSKVNFQVNLKNDETFQTKWLDWSQASDAGKVAVVLDGDPEQAAELHLDVAGTGSQQEYILTGTMTLPNVSAETSHTAELYFNDSLYYGAYASFTQQPVNLADASAYTIGVNSGGWPSGIENVVFLQDAEVPVLGFTDNNTGYTYHYLGTDDVQWTVSDPEVVQLTAFEGGGTDLSLTQTVKASIIPLKVGTATISLQCGNNGKGTTTASNSITITVKDSGRPSILFPVGADTVYARMESDQTVHFASNLSQHAPADGEITAKLYASSSVAEDATPVWETTLERTATSLTIPGDRLTAISQGSTPAYILRLTADAEVDSTVQHLSTEAKIIVHSQPAVITLRGLDDPMFTSGQSIEIGWTVENFDLATNPEECQFQFTVEKDGAAIYTNYDKVVSGSYTLTPATPDQLKDYYIITAKAKNGADPTWSIASSTITVYRDGALDILVGGEKRDSVTLKNDIAGGTTTAPSINTYAGETISGLTSAQAIAGLRSELSLIESIGINFRDFDWSILYDTVQWSTSTGQGDAISDELQWAVSINYREGSLYAPLEQYSYT